MSESIAKGKIVLNPPIQSVPIPMKDFRSSKDDLMRCEHCGEHWSKHVDLRWCRESKS